MDRQTDRWTDKIAMCATAVAAVARNKIHDYSCDHTWNWQVIPAH